MLIKKDIDALDDKCIAIKDNWKLKHEFGTLAVLNHFAPATRQGLLEKMAPLMQSRNIQGQGQGQGEALAWELDIVAAQHAARNHPELRGETKARILLKVKSLSMNLNQVRQKSPIINALQQESFWGLMSLDELEKARAELRSITHLRDKGRAPPVLIYDIPEQQDKFEIKELKTNIRTVDYEIYRQEVEKALEPVFNQDPVLQKFAWANPSM